MSLFLVLLVGAVLAGATLVLLAPTLVDPDRTVPVWVLVTLGVVLIGCGLTARSVRPDHRRQQ